MIAHTKSCFCRASTNARHPSIFASAHHGSDRQSKRVIERDAVRTVVESNVNGKRWPSTISAINSMPAIDWRSATRKRRFFWRQPPLEHAKSVRLKPHMASAHDQVWIWEPVPWHAMTLRQASLLACRRLGYVVFPSPGSRRTTAAGNAWSGTLVSSTIPARGVRRIAAVAPCRYGRWSLGVSRAGLFSLRPAGIPAAPTPAPVPAWENPAAIRASRPWGRSGRFRGAAAFGIWRLAFRGEGCDTSAPSSDDGVRTGTKCGPGASSAAPGRRLKGFHG
jgi:hypothetical protein